MNCTRGIFPSSNKGGRLCLLEDPPDSEDHQVFYDNNIENHKMILIWVGFIFLEVVFFNYMAWRVRRFLRGYCPKKKMSCIGKYKRNTINIQQTTRWLLFWLSSLLLDIPFQSALEESQTLSKQSKFFLWNAKGVFLNECFIFIQLSIEVPDTRTKLVKSGQFYVRSPSFEPRRPILKLGSPIFEPIRVGLRSPILEPRWLHQSKRKQKEEYNVLEERTSEGSLGTKNEQGFQNKAGNQSGSRVQNHKMVVHVQVHDLPSLPCVYDTYS